MDQTLKVEKTPEQLEAERIQAEKDLAAWYQQSSQLKQLKESEMALRNKVVQYYFPDGLKEGTNKAALPESWQIKVTGTINRKVNVEVEAAVREQLKNEYKVDAGELIKYKPEIDLPAYRALVANVVNASPQTVEHHKAILKCFEQMLIISDGSPQVELVEPKKPKAKVSVI